MTDFAGASAIDKLSMNVAITPVGRDARKRHWEQLDALHSWTPPAAL